MMILVSTNNVLISVFALLGFLNAAYLWWQIREFEQKKRPIYCVIGGKCADVVTSKFGQTCGIKNELIGMAYYAGMVGSVVARSVVPEMSAVIDVGMLSASLVAAAFSLYLFFLQAFVLEQWCSWCLIAIVLNIGIFWTLLP